MEAVELEPNPTDHVASEPPLARAEGPRPAPRADTSTCWSDDDVLEFSEGRLDPARLERMREHLECCAVCVELVGGAASDWAPLEPTDLIELANNFRAGDVIAGRFEIVRFLGRGGMGEVYEAHDAQRDQRVALKAVLATLCDNRRVLACLRREARVGRRIRHPSVCRVHHVASAALPSATQSVPFFTMDLIEGETLGSCLRRAPLPLPLALTIARDLLLGLRAIHQAGVLHLDFKSNNIMLTGDAQPRPVILDFGLARKACAASSSRACLAREGSLPYMPPEQLLGAPPAQQNDVFAFGVVLFEMLTARLPVKTSEPSQESRVARRGPIEPPSPSELAPGVEPWLDEVVRRCLADVEERYWDVGEVIAGLCDPRFSRMRPQDCER